MVSRNAGTLAALLLLAGCGMGMPPSGRKPDPAASPVSFVDAQPGSGLDFPLGHDLGQDLGVRDTNGHPAAILDADGDGLPDVLLAGPGRVTLFRNMGGWKFAPVTDAGFRQEGDWQGVAVGDVNNDGRPDVYLSGFGCAALYLNRGGGRFQDVTAASGLGTGLNGRWATSAAFLDADRDGWLDLYVTCYLDLRNETGVCLYPGGVRSACGPSALPAQRGVLYRNRGNATFVDVTRAFGLDAASGKGLGVAAADVNGDGYPDLYLANDKVPCNLFLNQGGHRFVDVGLRSATAFGPDGFVQGGMGVDFGDYDNDGREDLVVTTFQREPTSIYHKDGAALFANRAFESHIGGPTSNTVGYGVKWADLDNDGRLDLVIANGHPLHRVRQIDASTDYRQRFQVFHNRDGKVFDELGSVGPGLPSAIVGRALCSGDLDNDGRMDLLISNIEGQPLLLRNELRSAGHWITVRLESKRAFEGAVVIADTGERKWVRRSTTGGSYLSASDSRVHFGLGTATALKSLEVRWPWGVITHLSNVSVDRIVTVHSP